MSKSRGFSVIAPNAKPSPPREPAPFRPLRISPELQIAWERARAVQPPLKSLVGKHGSPEMMDERYKDR